MWDYKMQHPYGFDDYFRMRYNKIIEYLEERIPPQTKKLFRDPEDPTAFMAKANLEPFAADGEYWEIKRNYFNEKP